MVFYPEFFWACKSAMHASEALSPCKNYPQGSDSRLTEAHPGDFSKTVEAK